MTVPQPSSDLEGQLLQEIWNFAEATQRWPTVAEIDERYPHRRKAADVLYGFPPGLIYGIGPQHPERPDGDLRLGLTVAAITSCQLTDDVISAFLAFIRQLGSSCRSRLITPGTFLRSSSAAIPYDSISQISIRYELAASGRVGKDLAEQYARELLKLVVEIETAGWAIIATESELELDDPWLIDFTRDGWVIDFDQSFGTFAEVKDLDDYWSGRFKPWEFYFPSQATDRNARSMQDPHEQAHIFRRDARLVDDSLLASIETKAEGRTAAFVPCLPLDYKINWMRTMDSLQRLASRGYILRPTLDPDPGFPTASLTSKGIAYLKNVHASWARPAYRNRAARDALLSWLCDQRSHPQGYVPVQNFLADRHSINLGNFLSPDDIDAAASYLMERGLIRGTNVDQQHGPGLARITASGIDCIEEGGSVSDYLKRPATGGSNYTFNAPVSATNFAAGDHAEQYALSQGITTAEVRDLMQAIMEAIPGLSLPSAQSDEIRVIAAQVITDAEEGPQDTARLRKAAHRLRAILAASSRTALSTALTALIDSALAKAGLPPGGAA